MIEHPNILKLEKFSKNINHWIFLTRCVADRQNDKAMNVIESIIDQKETPTEY